MDVELRPVTDDEFRDFLRVLEGAFGFHAPEGNVADMRATTEIDRTIAVFDGDEIVATAGAYSFDLTLPGLVTEPAAGVTYVTVRSTHRRRGLLRQMMDHQLDDVAERGESLAILTASEGAIYGRFGYGLASWEADWSIPTEGATVARPSTAPGQLRIVTSTEAAGIFPAVYDRCRRSIVGAVTRNQAWWDRYFKDPEWDRDGATPRFYVVHDDADGTPDGILAFRRKSGWDHGLPIGTLIVTDLYAADPEVETALWQYAIDHDLVRTVTARARPTDEAMRWRFADSRRLRCEDVTDAVWARLLDLPRALSARRYGTTDGLVVDIVDPFRPANEGRYLIDGSPDGAEASRTDRPADLAMDIADLGSLYLGGTTATVLARAARVTEEQTGALRRADAFFSSSPLPWLTTHF